jgi:hypothetical protein
MYAKASAIPKEVSVRMRTEAQGTTAVATGSHSNGPQAATPRPVREINLPREARRLSTLSRVDYTDAFLLETGHAQDRTGEQWARAMLEDASAGTRKALRQGWFALGLRLGPTSDRRRVLGWEVRRSSPDLALLATSSRIGAEAEVLCKRQQDSVLVATFMKLNNPIARLVWGQVAPRHRRVLRHLLSQAGRRETRRHRS